MRLRDSGLKLRPAVSISTSMLTADIAVFISYSHDSPRHEMNVLALADRLRADGVDAVVDQYQSAPPEGWQLWMEKQIRDAKFVLLVCTETYLRRVMKEEDPGAGLGVIWESTISYSHLYNAGVVNEKFIPVIFGQGDKQYIPVPLQPTTYYDVSTDAGYERLYRRLTDQPETPATPLGKRRALPPRPRPASQPPTQPLARPAPNLAHPYPQQANFTGRADERRELTAWLEDDAHPIYALVAMGGMGKSALAWYWVKNDMLAPAQHAAAAAVEGVMWWSFYEGESSFTKFVDDALRYVSGRPIDAALSPTPYDRAQELRRHLQTKRVLFVLDGFERQLRAYARLDAAYRRDAAADALRDARDCVDPITARWLKDIAAGATRAKVLLTTRLMARDLEDRAGGALAGVLKRELVGLPRDDAVAFMQSQGVKRGTPAEIASACAAYGNHPLSLRLLSGLIARDTRTPGDIAAAPRHDVHTDLVQRRHHILEQSYDALPKKERALLSRIAAFRSPMTYDALTIFDEFGFLNRPHAKKFEAALNDLQERGLLQRDLAHNRYDLHPIVRRYAYDRLNDKTGVHARLRDYFAKIPAPGRDAVQSIEDLMPLIELYHHTVSAGRYDEAFKLLSARLIPDPLFFRFGAYQLMIELSRALFPEGEDRPLLVKDASAQAWILNALGAPYALSGQPRRAVPLFELSNIPDERRGNIEGVAIGLQNIASQQSILGELAAAERNLQRSIGLSHDAKDIFREAVGHQDLGRLLIYRGAFDEAARELDVAFGVFEKLGEIQSICVVWSFRSLRALLMRDARAALEGAQRAYDIAINRKNERDTIRTGWLLGAALVKGGNDLNSAATHLADALSRCRRINMVDHEPDILLAWAGWHHARGDARATQADAQEALAIAERCEYRLKQAEVHNFLARVAVDGGEREEARRQAETARGRAWCDGPPHCYKPALDEAEGMLRELGVDESVLNLPPAAGFYGEAIPPGRDIRARG